MANKVQNPESDLMVETKGKLELFFDNYGNKFLKGITAVAAVAVVIFAIVSISKNSAAKNEAAAQAALTLALTSEADVTAFEAIVAEYDGTAAANTAIYMVGAKRLVAGDVEGAKAILETYKDGEGAAAEVINGLVYALRGDIAVEQNDLQSAADLFVKAMAASEEAYTYENGARKLALVYESMGDMAKAQQVYKDMVAKYPNLTSKYVKYINE